MNIFSKSHRLLKPTHTHVLRKKKTKTIQLKPINTNFSKELSFVVAILKTPLTNLQSLVKSLNYISKQTKPHFLKRENQNGDSLWIFFTERAV